jgi:hypothetical protein
LDTTANNTSAWDLDKGNQSHFEYEYACVENFSTTISFEELKNRFGLDPHVLVEVTNFFANHLNVPKKGFKVYVEPLKNSPYVSKVEKQVKQASSVITRFRCAPWRTIPWSSCLCHFCIMVIKNSC